MIVAILLAYLDRINQRRHFKDVFIGVGAALLVVLGGGIAAYLVIRQYDGSTVQTVFETVTYLVAACVLTYMTFWMQAHSRTMTADLQRRSEEALNGRARWGLGLLAFQAVGREGLETMVFTLAIVFASSTQAATSAHGHGLLFGALLGLGVALVVAYVIFKLGRRLNLGLFFRVIGVVLMVFAAGLLADAVSLAGDPGRVITIADHEAAAHHVRFTGDDPAGRAPEALPELARLITAGQLSVPVWRSCPLADAAAAHADLEAGRNHGKIVLLP